MCVCVALCVCLLCTDPSLHVGLDVVSVVFGDDGSLVLKELIHLVSLLRTEGSKPVDG